MSAKQMPKIDTSALELTDREAAIVAKIVKPDGSLRATKPNVPVQTRIQTGPGILDYEYRHTTEDGDISGEAAYVWRMVAFYASPNQKHHCMPTTECVGMSGKYSEYRLRCKELDVLVDRILDIIPKEQWHGVRRWGQAYGMIGTPVVSEGGSIVYR